MMMTEIRTRKWIYYYATTLSSADDDNDNDDDQDQGHDYAEKQRDVKSDDGVAKTTTSNHEHEANGASDDSTHNI